MKLTKSKLKQIIKEEIQTLSEDGASDFKAAAANALTGAAYEHWVSGTGPEGLEALLQQEFGRIIEENFEELSGAFKRAWSAAAGDTPNPKENPDGMPRVTYGDR